MASAHRLATTPVVERHSDGPPSGPFLDDPELRADVFDLAHKFGVEHYRAVCASGDLHNALWRELGDRGYLGLHLPVEVSGGGRGLWALGLVLEQTAAAGYPLPPALFSGGVNGMILAGHGTPEQRRRWLPGIASGDTVSAFALTETEAGSNTHRLRCRAVRDGADWVLSGDKTWVSGFDAAPWVLVMAATGDDPRRSELSLFVVDTDEVGLSATPVDTDLTVPQRTFDVRFNAVRVSGDRLIGRPGAGLRAAFVGMNAERVLVSSICTGLARYAIDAAVGYARDRIVWDVPIGAHQALSHPLARAHVDAEVARLVANRAYAEYDAGRSSAEWCNMAKLTAVDAGLRALDCAIQTFGGLGMASRTGLAPFWALMRAYMVGPVSQEMALNYVAEHVLGLPRSY